MDYSLIEQDLEETPEGEVYFIFEKNTSRPCKIGKSINPRKRTAQLQTGNFRELYVYQTLKGYDRLETMMHEYFDEYRIRKTEWFDITFIEIDVIIDQYNALQVENEQILEGSTEVNISESENASNDGSEQELENSDYELDDDSTSIIPEVETFLVEKVTETRTTTKISKINKHKCKKCGKKFNKEKYLKQHLKRITSCSASYKCEKCGINCQSASLLKRHYERKTPCVTEPTTTITRINEENKCDMCGNTYASASNLRRHQNTCVTKNETNVLISLLKNQQEQTKLLNTLADVIKQNIRNNK